MNITEELLGLQDLDYKKFHAKLVPTMDSNTIIGIRTPVLRTYAKNLIAEKDRKDEITSFLNTLPHTYYEENNLHMALLGYEKQYETCLFQLNRFLPYIDNWATCDFPQPKCFAKHTEELLTPIQEWLADSHPYIIRYGIHMLMSLYLDEHFDPIYLTWVAKIRSDEYYVNMMIAWYFATALAKQYDQTIPYLEQHKLDDWTHHKAIRKAIESYRITEETKTYLRSLL